MSTFKIFLRFSGPFILFVLLAFNLKAEQMGLMWLGWGILLWSVFWTIWPNGFQRRKCGPKDPKVKHFHQGMFLCYTFPKDESIAVYSNKEISYCGDDYLYFADGSWAKILITGEPMANNRYTIPDLFVLHNGKEVFPCEPWRGR